MKHTIKLSELSRVSVAVVSSECPVIYLGICSDFSFAGTQLTKDQAEATVNSLTLALETLAIQQARATA